MKKGFAVLALVSCLGFSSFSTLRAEDQPSPQDLYKKKCAMCHKADGKGYSSMKTPDFTSKEWQDSKKNDELIESVSKGKPPMPAFEKQLKPEEIQSLITDVVRKFVEESK
ncbi:MAG: c-type cytochrome [Terriglobia bacterium]